MIRVLHCVAALIVMISATSVAGAQAAPALAEANGGTPASSCKAKVADLKKLKAIREKQITALRTELGVKEVSPPPSSGGEKEDRPGMHPVSPPPPQPSCTAQRNTLNTLIANYEKQIARLKQQVADKRAAAEGDARPAAASAPRG